MKKDCVFLLADKSMEETFKGFLGRDKFYLSIDTRSFTYVTFSPDRRSGDSGIWKNAHDYLERYRAEYRHAIVVLDNKWEHGKTPVIIQQEIKLRLVGRGWDEENIEVIVIEPELEIWLWQDSPHIAQAFKDFDFKQQSSLRRWLEARGYWQVGATKPTCPKEAFLLFARASKTPYSSAIYQRIASRISVRHCIDPSFCLLRDTLQRWFPQDGEQP